MRKEGPVRIVGTGGEYRMATGDVIRNWSRTVPMTRADAASLLRHLRRTMVRGFLRTVRVEEE